MRFVAYLYTPFVAEPGGQFTAVKSVNAFFVKLKAPTHNITPHISLSSLAPNQKTLLQITLIFRIIVRYF